MTTHIQEHMRETKQTQRTKKCQQFAFSLIWIWVDSKKNQQQQLSGPYSFQMDYVVCTMRIELQALIRGEKKKLAQAHKKRRK